MKKTVLLLTACALGLGCSGNRIASKYEPHNRTIFITKESLPASEQFEVIGTLMVEKDPCPVAVVTDILASQARKLGADAIIQFTTGIKPRLALTFTARYGTGVAIKVLGDSEAALSGLTGTWH